MPARDDSASEPHFVFRLPRRSLRIAGIAFGIGVLLSLLAMWLSRDKGFYTVPPVAPAASGSDIPALPEPLASGGDASGLGAPPPQAERPRVAEEAPPPPPPPLPQPIEETVQQPPPPPPSAASGPAQGGGLPIPIPGQNPPPDYPVRAMRAGETGTVLVRAVVGPDGAPADVGVGRTSGSRDLDRAAVDAVRRWRFQPAVRDGQPVTASVDIPIDFTLER